MAKQRKDVDKTDKEGYDDFVLETEESEGQGMKSKGEKKLREELKACLKQSKEYLEGWQRAKADLINFKKETEESRKKFAKFATEDLLLQLLPVSDSLEMAIAHTKDEGVRHIYKQLHATLKAHGVEQTDPLGETFDPTQHHSVDVVEVKNKKEDNTIVEVIQRGYTLNDKVIRPANVKVRYYKEK